MTCVERDAGLRRGAWMNIRANTAVIRPATETILGREIDTGWVGEGDSGLGHDGGLR